MLPGITPPIVSKGPVISSFIASTVVVSSAASFNITMTPTTPGLLVLLAAAQGTSPTFADFSISGSTMTLHLSSTLTTPGSLLGAVAIASQTVATSGAKTITVNRASTSTNSNTHAFSAWVLTNYASTTPVATTYTQLITTTTTVGTGISLQYTAGASGHYLFIAGSSSDLTWSSAVSRVDTTSGVIRYAASDKQSNIPIASHTETVTLTAPSTTVGRRIVGATWR